MTFASPVAQSSEGGRKIHFYCFLKMSLFLVSQGVGPNQLYFQNLHWAPISGKPY